MEIDKLIKRLCQVTKFDVEVSFMDEKSALGQATVEVEHTQPTSVIWRENGHWNQRFNFLNFTNVYRWSILENGQLGLEHLRFGDQNPVRLVELIKTTGDYNSGIWRSVSPHKCGKDSYDLEFVINVDDLTLIWHIHGPGKNQTSLVCYS